MPDRSASERAGEFVRSVLPAEPAHWLMLLGATLLYVSSGVVWWSRSLSEGLPRVWPADALLLMSVFLISGSAAYYLCFVPAKRRRTRWPYLLTLVPAAMALLAMAAIVVLGLSEDGMYVSVIDRAVGRMWKASDFRILLEGLDTGFYTAALGLALVAIVFVLCRVGRGTLPIRLAQPISSQVDGEAESSEHRLTMRFVWIMISLTILAGAPAQIVIAVRADWLFGGRLSPTAPAAFFAVTRALSALSLLFLILLAAMPHAKSVLRDSFRLPPLRYAGIAILIPASLGALWPAAHYLQAWATFESGSIYAPPHLWPYFGFPMAAELWRLLPALAEEIAWRGFLQPRFIRRYGLARGIFFVGLVWGAFHFGGDFGGRMAAVGILLRVLWRLSMTVAQGYVLGWLTIRSRSVLPAALAHGFYNIFLHVPGSAPYWAIPVLWGVCALLLFRYFPVTVAEPEDSGESNLAESLPA